MIAEGGTLSPDAEARLARFKGGERLGLAKPFLIVVFIFLLGTLFLGSFLPQSNIQSFHRYDRSLQGVGTVHSERFAVERLSHYRWLQKHGTESEERIYVFASDALIDWYLTTESSFLATSRTSGVSATIGKVVRFILVGMERSLFVFLSSARIWLLVLLVSALWSIYSIRPHRGKDLLGVTGSGKLYYSGIRAGLHKVTADGTPSQHVPGLACPLKAKESVVLASRLYQVLTDFAAVTETNKELASALLAHSSWPAYIPPQLDSDGTLRVNSPLDRNAAVLLQGVLEVHKEIRERKEASPDQPPSGRIDWNVEPQLPVVASSDGELSSEQYVARVKIGLNRVLTSDMRQVLSEVPPELVATVVLSLEAGKILAFAYEGSRWWKKSNFPQLSARAILHSLYAYGDEYSYSARALVRRAIIYGKRDSVMGPVRLPTDLSKPTRALRQWTEILLAEPENLEAVVNEVELFGLCTQIYRRWCHSFGGLFRSESINKRDVWKRSFCSKAKVLFLPLSLILDVSKDCIDADEFKRLERLFSVVSRDKQKQRSADPDESSSHLDTRDNVLPPLSSSVIEKIAKEYAHTPDEIRRWGLIRGVLDYFAWIARRVGSSTIPEAGVVYGAFAVSHDNKERNSYGYVGRMGVVPMRTSSFQSLFGTQWEKSIPKAEFAKVTGSKSDYERLLQGGSELHSGAGEVSDSGVKLRAP